ncbi:hypothetical protein QPL79_06870 [Ignisphaera sp. 4213-co]|uniref:RING-type domain-containing protein n=1 Tax=Ignisphaera cupida TaxID=3050454 RepID=A0ABD4Z7U9_9CREN|nr:hypothetical protein [Ignisphaera sp. 4213-co]MDK6029082.1 hypothetical protein [Ignisphaera sp. 4213-co]
MERGSNRYCIICGKEIKEDEKSVKCSICGSLMHEDCVDREILEDAEGNVMCPYDAALAALDWLDAIVTTYHNSLKSDKNKLNDVVERLKNYLAILEKE